MFAIVGPKPDGLYLQIVPGLNKTYCLALSPHQDRMCDCRHASARSHTSEQGAVANAGCAEDNVLSVRQIVRCVNAVEVLFVAVADEILSLFVVARPHSALHVAAEAFDRRGREHCFGRTTDAHVKI